MSMNLACLYHITKNDTLLLLGGYPTPASPQNLPPPFLSRHTLTYTVQKDGPKTQQWEHDDSSNHTKNAQSGNPSWKHAPQKLKKCQKLDPLITTKKRASIIKTSLIPPTITHSNWSTCLRSQLWSVHSPHTTQPSPNSVHLTSHHQASFW